MSKEHRAKRIAFKITNSKSQTPIESKNNFLPPPRGRIKVGGKGPGCPPLSEPEAL
jgi:hypothetical protein